MPLVPGSRSSQKTKTADISTAEANSGIEVVMIAKMDMNLSSPEPSFIPARIPKASPRTVTIASTTAAKMPVFFSRGKSTSATSVLKRIDSPKSPTMKLPSHRP